MKVVVAPSAFKGTLSAWEAADSIAEGVRQALPGTEIAVCPVADGGTGTAEILRRSVGGRVEAREVSGPLGSLSTTSFVRLDDGRAALDVASAASLELCGGRVMEASSIGVGDLIAYAAKQEPSSIIVGLGDSGTSEGGVGLLVALGLRFLDAGGVAIPTTPGGLQSLHAIEGGLDLPPVIAASDVRNPLLGPQGAAATFGPQKGATPEGVRIIEAGLMRLADAIEDKTGRRIHDMPRAGAAGGIAGGLYGLLGAELRDGFDVVAEAVGFEGLLDDADLLIVGEGSLDLQSLEGKAPVRAARMAQARGIEATAICGRVSPEIEDLVPFGLVGAHPLGSYSEPPPADVPAALVETSKRVLSA